MFRLVLSASLASTCIVESRLAFRPADIEDEVSLLLRQIPRCREESLNPGDLCRGGGSKDFGTSSNLNNYGSLDIYKVSACRATPVAKNDLPSRCKQPAKRKNRSWLLRRLEPCHLVEPGELCRAEEGGCSTDNALNNCGNFDIYRRETYEEMNAEDEE
jgi:hypothetical protein